MTFRRHQAVLRALERLYAWTNVTTSRNLHNYFPHLHGGDPDLRVLRADLKAEAHPSPNETTVRDNGRRRDWRRGAASTGVRGRCDGGEDHPRW